MRALRFLAQGRVGVQLDARPLDLVCREMRNRCQRPDMGQRVHIASLLGLLTALKCPSSRRRGTGRSGDSGHDVAEPERISSAVVRSLSDVKKAVAGVVAKRPEVLAAFRT